MAKVLLIALVGCGTTYPIDRVVVIQPTSELASYPGIAVELHIGAHMWDQLGVHFETAEDLPPANAQTIVAKCDTQSDMDSQTHGSNVVGEYDQFDGEISIDCSYFSHIPSNFPFWSIVVAHEVGHAIGLAHVKDSSAIMNAVAGNAAQSLTLADVGEFDSVTGEDFGCIPGSYPLECERVTSAWFAQ